MPSESNISTYLQAIRTAVYGKDVRAAIANGIEACYARDIEGNALIVDKEDIANEFSASESYTIGEYVYYEGDIYRFTANHSGAWNSNHASKIVLADEIANINITSGDSAAQIALQNIAPEFESGSYSAGDYVIHDNVLYKFTSNHTGAWTGSDATAVVITDELIPAELESTVSGHTQELAEIRQLIEDYHYTAITVSSLAINPTIADIKSTVTEVTATYKLSKDAVTMTLAGQSITDPAKLTGGTTQTVTLTGSWTKTSQATQAFKIIVTDERGASANKSVNLTFANRAYYGVSTVPGTLNETFIKGLATNLLTTTKARTISVNAGSNQYIYYAYPKRLGTCTFTVGGFAGGFSGPTEVSVTNDYAYTETYYVYRSDNDNLGSTSVVIA